jgi:DNA-binding NtrC family response regulator
VGGAGGQRWRVLVVEDFDQLRELFVAGLRAAGYQVDGAASVVGALGLRPESYHVLVTDMRLGDEDGMALLEIVGAADPTIASRSVLMTGGGFEERPPAGIPVLVKPFRIEALVDAVRRLAEDRNAQGNHGSA